MDRYFGFDVRFNAVVARGSYLVNTAEGVVVFRDREDLHRTIFWARVMPRLNVITRDCWEAWRTVR